MTLPPASEPDLTPAQLDGLACAACGASALPTEVGFVPSMAPWRQLADGRCLFICADGYGCSNPK